MNKISKIAASIVFSALICGGARADMSSSIEGIRANASGMLSVGETRAGAVLTCLLATHDFKSAEMILQDYGWEKTETTESVRFTHLDLSISVDLSNNACELIDSAGSTDGLNSMLLVMKNRAGFKSRPVSDDNCTRYIVAEAVSVAISGIANRKACSSNSGASIRFQSVP